MDNRCSCALLQSSYNDRYNLHPLITSNNAKNAIEASTKGLKDLGVFSSIVGHLGDGNFHEAIMYHKDDPVEAAAVAKHVKSMIVRALSMDGTSTVS